MQCDSQKVKQMNWTNGASASILDLIIAGGWGYQISFLDFSSSAIFQRIYVCSWVAMSSRDFCTQLMFHRIYTVD